MSTAAVDTEVVDPRAVGALDDAGDDVAALWTRAGEMSADSLPGMGLSAGERPAADVEVLCSSVAIVEYELARRMHAASAAGALPLVGAGAVLLARGWSATWARRLAAAGGFAEQHRRLADVWGAGIITSEHVWSLHRHQAALTAEEMDAVIEELTPLWGQLSPRAVAVFVQRVVRMLHPPPDPEPDEWEAHEARSLSFAVTADSVLVSGSLPRLEGEVVMAAIDAYAERLRSEADHVPAGARRADALVELVNSAHASGSLPTRGGLPVSVSVTLQGTATGDVAWTTSRDHNLTSAEQRFSSCDALVTPVVVSGSECGADAPAPSAPDPGVGAAPTQSGDRIAALAATLLGSRVPLAMGRSARTATPAQRRSLAVRDRGCVIPGCGVPAEACQTHHVREWAAGGSTDVPNMVLLCWAHHRQVDLGMWSIVATEGASPPPEPGRGSPTGTPWPANNGAPWIVTRRPRSRWRS